MLMKNCAHPEQRHALSAGGPSGGGAMLKRTLTLSADGSERSFGEVLCK